MNRGGGNLTNFGYDASQNRIRKQQVTATSDTSTYYIRDAQGTVLAVYRQYGSTVAWQEQHLYGSSRVGSIEPGVSWTSAPASTPYFRANPTLRLGTRRYELTDHLGNVRALIGDRRTLVNAGNAATQYYSTAVLNGTDYFPFGSEMRSSTLAKYRYGFNGKELDRNKEFGILNQYDYGFRIYNPGIGRFLSVDPLTKDYPWYSPYQFAGNTPIQAIDLDGLEPFLTVGTNQRPSNKDQINASFLETIDCLVENVATNKHNLKKAPLDYGFDWSKSAGLFNGTLNTVNDRTKAAIALTKYVVDHHVEGEPITLIGYSHGGNVDAQAAPMIKEATGETVNLITLATPAANQSRFTYYLNSTTNTISSYESPRWKENPENPDLKRSISSWYHFYIPKDGVAGGLSGIYEGSSLEYKSSWITQFQISEKDMPSNTNNFGRHGFPYYPNSVKNSWNNSKLNTRQPNTNKTK